MRVKCISKGPLDWLEVGRFYTIKKEGGIWWIKKYHYPLCHEVLKECFGFCDPKRETYIWEDVLKYLEGM